MLRTFRSLLLIPLLLLASGAPVGASPIEIEREVWEPCVAYDRGTLPDGRKVWRSIQVERRFDGSCPSLDDPCIWADINWDGYVGGPDFLEFTLCSARELDFMQE